MQRILYLEHNVDGSVGGSHYCLLDICRLIDRRRYSAMTWFYEDNALLPEFERSHAYVIVSRPLGPVVFPRTSRWATSRPVQLLKSMVNFMRVVVVNTAWWMRQLRRHHIDVVHLNNNCFADIDLQLAALFLRVPLVSHQRGFPGKPTWLARKLANAQRAVIAISRAVEVDLAYKGVKPGKLHLVHDGIDPARLQSVDATQSDAWAELTSGGQRTIGIVGNVKRWKGQAVVVRAMCRIKERFPDIVCWIVGSESSPDYAAELKDLVKSLALQEQVRFLGFRKDSSQLMRHMEVVLHASIAPEPFGIVILEAMHHSRPVVASAHGGPLDIVVDGQTGYLTRPGDPDELADRVITLLADPALCNEMGRRGHERFLAEFTAERTIRAIESVYEDVCQR